MGMLRIMTSFGDRVHQWDRKLVETGDPEALSAVREAERVFEEQRAKGATSFRVTPGVPAERIDRFDPESEQIVVVPRVVGG
jgi:hypothetical protein